MEQLINILDEGNFSCVIQNHDEIRTFTQRGVADLFELYSNDCNFLKGAIIADKIVGKAAAVLMVAGGIRGLHTHTISEQALSVFDGSGIEVTYGQSVPVIINRTRTDWCPMEKLCKDEESIEKLIDIIADFQHKLNEKNTFK